MPLLKRYHKEDYHQALLALLPQGVAWEIEEDNDLYRLLEAWAADFAKFDRDIVANVRQVSALDEHTIDFLPEWEELFGTDQFPVYNQHDLGFRRALIRNVALARGVSVRNRISLLAKLMDLDVELAEFANPPRRYGRAKYRVQPYGKVDSNFTFYLKINNRSSDHEVRRRHGEARHQKDYGKKSIEYIPPDARLFEALVNFIKPAHTIALFRYALDE